MAYQRKTRDVWQLWTNYGYGWEVEVEEETRAEIRQRYKEYAENTNAELKIKKVRERIDYEPIHGTSKAVLKRL